MNYLMKYKVHETPICSSVGGLACQWMCLIWHKFFICVLILTLKNRMYKYICVKNIYYINIYTLIYEDINIYTFNIYTHYIYALYIHTHLYICIHNANVLREDSELIIVLYSAKSSTNTIVNILYH